MRKLHWLLSLNIFFTILLAACTPGTLEPTNVSPLNSPVHSPLTTPTLKSTLTPFQIDKPIGEGTTEVTGQGVVGTPVVLADITLGGVVLGNTTINREGKFEIKVSTPLEEGHRIGLTLGNLSSTKNQPEDFYDKKLYGDEALNVPQIGFFFDTAMVKD